MPRKASSTYSLFLPLILSVIAVSVSGCGQKGPLYLAQRPVPLSTSTSETSTGNLAAPGALTPTSQKQTAQ